MFLMLKFELMLLSKIKRYDKIKRLKDKII